MSTPPFSFSTLKLEPNEIGLFVEGDAQYLVVRTPEIGGNIHDWIAHIAKHIRARETERHLDVSFIDAPHPT